MTIPQALARTAAKEPGRTAVIFRDRQLNYSQLNGSATRLAQGLAALGVKPGDRVALLCPNCDAFVISYFGIMRAGATVIPINPLLKAPEIAYILKDAGVCGALVFAVFAPTFTEALDQAGINLSLLSIGGEIEDALAVEAILATDHEDQSLPEFGDDAIAAILYTSGTTGRPKGAMLSHRNIVFDADAAIEHFGFLGDDRLLIVLPMFHAFAATAGLVIPVRIGASIVALERFTPQGVIEAIASHGVTLFLCVPTMLAALLRAADAVDTDFSSLRACISGGAPLPLPIMEAFEARFGVTIHEGDGPTECGPITSVTVPGQPRKPGTVGPALPGVEIRAVDDDDNAVPTGEVGELVVRGDNVMVGYLNQPEATAEAMRGGWFHTGDLGTIDEDGYITIVDRKKDLIIVGGLNVYPSEVDEVLLAHPGVEAAAAIGMYDQLRGERVKAFVIRRAGSDVTETELLGHCRDRLANFKIPKAIEFVESLPMSLTGKVLRRELRDPHA